MVDNIDRPILMKQKELTKTLMMILNWKKPFAFHVLYKNISVVLQGLKGGGGASVLT